MTTTQKPVCTTCGRATIHLAPSGKCRPCDYCAELGHTPPNAAWCARCRQPIATPTARAIAAAVVDATGNRLRIAIDGQSHEVWIEAEDSAVNISITHPQTGAVDEYRATIQPLPER